MQNHYNLIYREEEREMLPLCLDQGVGVIPWSPLARGRLTRDWDTTTARSETDEFGQNLYLPEDQQIHEQVAEVASARGDPAGAGRPGLASRPPRRDRADRRRDRRPRTSMTPSPR